MDAWLACKDKVLIPGDVLRWQKPVFEQSRGKWKKIGLVELTGQLEEEGGEWLTMTLVDSVVLEDKTGGRKVHAPARIPRQRFKRTTIMGGRPRRRPWPDGEDVRAELVRARIGQTAIETHLKREDTGAAAGRPSWKLGGDGD